MGIVKISDELHEEIRRASAAMVRSINSQAEFWIKIGMLAETNPSLTYTQIIHEHLRSTTATVFAANPSAADATVTDVVANSEFVTHEGLVLEKELIAHE